MERFIKSDKIFYVDSANKAYTLGYLWGDGDLYTHKYKDNTKSNIYYPRLEIKCSDLDEVISLFADWGNWNTYYRNRSNRQPLRMT